jgi:predicted RNase H-like HicB family nuclease
MVYHHLVRRKKMTANTALVIKVELKKEGGIFYASSVDLPGLHVCGYTEDETCESVIPAVVALLKHNRGMDVRVIPATNDLESFPRLGHHCNQFVALAA